MWSNNVNDSFGGGFVKDEAKAGPGPSANKDRIDTRVRNMVAVNCDQISNLTHSEFGMMIFNQQMSMVKIVAVVDEVQESGTKTVYVLNDGSGPRVEATKWHGDDTKPMADVAVLSKSYVKIYGNVRNIQSKPTIIVFKMENIKNYNEVMQHKIEVVHNSMVLKQMKDNKGSGLAAAVAAPGQANNNNPAASGFSDPQTSILNAIKACISPEGITTVDIQRSLKSLDLNTIKKNIEFLQMEGHIFSTFDEDHFKATED